MSNSIRSQETPSGVPVAITVGQDQRFKVWQLGEPERRKGIAGTRSPHSYPHPKPRMLNC